MLSDSMPRNHFDISENSQDYDYSSRVNYFGGGNPIPQRDRAAHAQHVAAMFLAAKEATATIVTLHMLMKYVMATI